MSRGRSPRDISRAEGNLEVGGDVQPNTSRFEAVYGHSLIINPSLGMYQEIHPCRASSIDSVKINTSLPMMRECIVLYHMVLQCIPQYDILLHDIAVYNIVLHCIAWHRMVLDVMARHCMVCMVANHLM